MRIRSFLIVSFTLLSLPDFKIGFSIRGGLSSAKELATLFRQWASILSFLVLEDLYLKLFEAY